MAPSDATSPPMRGDFEGAAEPARVAVLIPLALDVPYDYRVPAELAAAPGSYVRVPLGPREALGVVWGEARGDIAPERLKDVAGVVDLPPMSEALRRFVDWVADYTLTRRGSVLRMVMSVPAAFEPPKTLTAYRLGAEAPERLTKARERVLALLADGLPRGAAEIAREAAVSSGVVRSLADTRVLEPVQLPASRPPETPDWAHPGPTLSAEQDGAAKDLVARTESGEFSVALLDGVTGSGKTEVYFEAVAAALKANKQVLVMLPEIALSAQWFARFRARFGAAPAQWHSELGQRERRETWRAVAHGLARVVVGARSALWLPFRELGLVVVDEEHDPAYKQEDGVIYQARDMAVVRARLEGCPIVPVSATPSLESIVNVWRERYDSLHLPDRHGGAQLPAIEAIDMRATPPPRSAWLSPPLRDALHATLGAGEQAVLFLNRRGYAPLTLCRACGHRLECPNCTSWLVEHRFAGTLNCHHCGHAEPKPTHCPACEGEDRLAACGPGVERLAEEVAALFPDARTEVVTSDTVAGPREAAAFIERITGHEIDLLIGTQIIAKGHHFPMLTLVGVVDADLGLAGGDLRAAERTYQLLHQVAGRAGRAARAGRVLLQTYMPEHAVMEALVSGERDAFLKREAEEREAHGQPPFGRLAAFILSSRNEAMAARVARTLARCARNAVGSPSDIEIFGPAPAPFALLRGRYRYRLLVKAPRTIRLQPHLQSWLNKADVQSGVRVRIDIDPYSFL